MVEETSKWGRKTAKERYGKVGGNLESSPKTNDLQKPQDPQDKQGSTYDNDASGWVRGHGSPYPYFDHGREGKN